MRPLRVLLVTSWGVPCGIAEHAKLLKASVEAADPGISVLPSAPHLDPNVGIDTDVIDLVHLNHHDGLHSRWTPEHVWYLRNRGLEVVVTYHDTRERLSDCPKLQALSQVASSTIVHEPVEGLKAIYWRQGVPAPAQDPAIYTRIAGHAEWIDGRRILYPTPWKAFPQQPVLGTCGFNFPWKNYDRLAQVTGEEGWALVILSNNATEADEARWCALNSSILVVREFLTQDQVVNYLAGCDATAFMYECANTGTSGAIRQGIAARKPVLALQTCRQFRDLYQDTMGVWWVGGWDSLRDTLQGRRGLEPGVAIDLDTHTLAHAESWDKLGASHAQLYRMLAAK